MADDDNGFYTIHAERLRVFDALTDPRAYDKRIRPAGVDATGPAVVNVSLHISVIGGLDAQTTVSAGKRWHGRC